MIAKVTPSAPLVLKTRHFDRFARNAGLDDAELLVAAIEVLAGRYDADLGGGVFKKRIARSGGGKSGGFRTVVICTNPEFTVFAYGYAKHDHLEPTPAQIQGFKAFARLLRTYSRQRAREAMVVLEVSHGN